MSAWTASDDARFERYANAAMGLDSIYPWLPTVRILVDSSDATVLDLINHEMPDEQIRGALRAAIAALREALQDETWRDDS